MRLRHQAIAVAAGLALTFVLTVPALSQAAEAAEADTPANTSSTHRKIAQEEIRQERAAISARRQSDEFACHQRFAVEDCMRKVRVDVREIENQLRSREIALNDAARKENAAERLRLIQEKQAAVRTSANVSDLGPGRVRVQSADPRETTVQRMPHRKQALVVQGDRQEQAADNAARAAKARSRHMQALEVAESRRNRIQKAQANAADQGRLPAPPLPDPLR